KQNPHQNIINNTITKTYTETKFRIKWTKPMIVIPATTKGTEENLSNIRFNGVKKMINDTTPYVLRSIPVVEEVIPISVTFKGNAKASVPLLIMIANAASDACKTSGCFNKGVNSEKLNFPFSVDLKDSSIYL